MGQFTCIDVDVFVLDPLSHEPSQTEQGLFCYCLERTCQFVFNPIFLFSISLLYIFLFAPWFSVDYQDFILPPCLSPVQTFAKSRVPLSSLLSESSSSVAATSISALTFS
ncbi:uncharacterized protein VTP21DRAFT_5734 [Calcarisporiella thermophila]|uniref:uncharacterized protein n=1 Tax=Calcarisporiella thermophila TaxID=911321 RepID=UPI003743C21D